MDRKELCKKCWCNFYVMRNNEEDFKCIRNNTESSDWCSDFQAYLEKSSYIRK